MSEKLLKVALNQNKQININTDISLVFQMSFELHLQLLDSLYYCNGPKFLDRHVWANSVDPDQTLLEEQSD